MLKKSVGRLSGNSATPRSSRTKSDVTAHHHVLRELTRQVCACKVFALLCSSVLNKIILANQARLGKEKGRLTGCTSKVRAEAESTSDRRNSAPANLVSCLLCSLILTLKTHSFRLVVFLLLSLFHYHLHFDSIRLAIISCGSRRSTLPFCTEAVMACSHVAPTLPLHHQPSDTCLDRPPPINTTTNLFSPSSHSIKY